MLLEIKARNGQSMYDLCLMTYGSLDYLVKLCTDNNITDINYLPTTGQVFVYDNTLIVDQSTSIIQSTAA